VERTAVLFFPEQPRKLHALLTRIYSTFALLAAYAALANDPAPLRLEPVFRLKTGQQQLITAEDFDFKKRQGELGEVVFLAVTTNTWPAGLVPLFAVEKTNRVELRRRAAAGQENSSEPLFFALPPADESAAARIAGRWECLGTRGTGTKEFFGWDLAVEGDSVTGRFDQFTDFRFARIGGGSFRSNRLELRVEYLMDAYLVKGSWHDGKMAGQWTRIDESESGVWEATRPAVILPAVTNLVALYEWKRDDGARRYLVETETAGDGWQRAVRPLCRVWRAPTTPRK
jgi:hypothetical protein